MLFEQARTVVEFAGIFMVALPMTVMGLLALQWYFKKKGSK